MVISKLSSWERPPPYIQTKAFGAFLSFSFVCEERVEVETGAFYLAYAGL